MELKLAFLRIVDEIPDPAERAAQIAKELEEWGHYGNDAKDPGVRVQEIEPRTKWLTAMAYIRSERKVCDLQISTLGKDVYQLIEEGHRHYKEVKLHIRLDLGYVALEGGSSRDIEAIMLLLEETSQLGLASVTVNPMAAAERFMAEGQPKSIVLAEIEHDEVMRGRYQAKIKTPAGEPLEELPEGIVTEYAVKFGDDMKASALIKSTGCCVVRERDIDHCKKYIHPLAQAVLA